MNRTQWKEKAGIATAEIDIATTKLATLLVELNEMIANLPDNPRINRIGANCFLIRSSDLGNNWSPEHHDFRRQYQRVIDAISTTATVEALTMFRKIVGQGWIYDAKESSRRFRFHSEVLDNLRSLL